MQRAESDEDGALSRRPVATMIRETWHRDGQASPLVRCQLCGDHMIDYESHICY